MHEFREMLSMLHELVGQQAFFHVVQVAGRYRWYVLVVGVVLLVLTRIRPFRGMVGCFLWAMWLVIVGAALWWAFSSGWLVSSQW